MDPPTSRAHFLALLHAVYKKLHSARLEVHVTVQCQDEGVLGLNRNIIHMFTASTWSMINRKVFTM